MEFFYWLFLELNQLTTVATVKEQLEPELRGVEAEQNSRLEEICLFLCCVLESKAIEEEVLVIRVD